MTKWYVWDNTDGQKRLLDIMPNWDLSKREHLIDRYRFLGCKKLVISPSYKGKS